jgi:hypothetical protein
MRCKLFVLTSIGIAVNNQSGFEFESPKKYETHPLNVQLSGESLAAVSAVSAGRAVLIGALGRANQHTA